MATETRKTVSFKTQGGHILRLRPIPLAVVELALRKVESELRASGQPLDPPGFHITPEFPDGTKGDPQWFAYTASTLDIPDDPKASSENHARWDAYQRAQETLSAAQGARRVALYLEYGVEVDGGVPGVPEPEDADQKITDYEAGMNAGEWMDDPHYWQTVSRMLGAELPTAPLELKARWLTERALSERELGDLIGEMVSLQMEGSLSAEDLDTFRRNIRASVADGIRARVISAFAPAEGVMDAPAHD